MRPRVPLGFHLILTGRSLSQVCVGGRLSLMMCVYTYDFLCVIIVDYWCRENPEG